MNNTEIRQRLLLSIQRALLGVIYPDITGILVDFWELKKLTVIFYLNRQPIEKDYECLSEVTGEILADIEFEEVSEICKLDNYLDDMSDKGIWVYKKAEG